MWWILLHKSTKKDLRCNKIIFGKPDSETSECKYLSSVLYPQNINELLSFLKRRRSISNATTDTIISCPSDHFQLHHSSYLSIYIVVDDEISGKYGWTPINILAHKLQRSPVWFLLSGVYSNVCCITTKNKDILH